MKSNDEIFSSSSNESRFEILVSFVGFQEHLVMNFLNTFLRPGVKEVWLFTSAIRTINLEKKQITNLELQKKAINLIEKTLNKSNVAKIFELENIWDFQEYYFHLSSFKGTDAIINISAGPSVFSAAGMIWALEHGYTVSYSVEFYDSSRLVSSVFNVLDLKPYISSIFSTDNVDKMIIEALKNGKNDTIQIHKYLNKVLGYELSLRSIENHLLKLNNLEIVEITRGKTNKVNLSQKLNKFGFLLKKSHGDH